MLDRLIDSGPFVELLDLIRQPRPPGKAVAAPVWADGLWGSAAPMLCAGLAEALGRQARRGQAVPPAILLVVAHLDQADDAVEDLELFLAAANDRARRDRADAVEVVLLPGWAGRPDYSEASDEIAAERLSVCRRLTDARSGGSSGDTILNSLLVPVCAPPGNSRIKYGVPGTLPGTPPGGPLLVVAPTQALQQPVVRPAGLSRSTLVLRAGQETSPDAVAAWLADHGFARVELVDVPGDFAVRGGILDVFAAGDRPPVRIDFFGDQIESIRPFDLDSQRSRPETLDQIELFGGLGQVTPDQTCSLLDYLPDGCLVAFCEPNEIEELGRAYLERTEDPTGLYPVTALLAPSQRLRQLMMCRFAPPDVAPVVRFGCQSLQRFETTPVEAVGELVRLADQQDVVVYCDNPAERQRLEELIGQQRARPPAGLATRLGFLHTGFSYPPAGFVLVGHHEIFHRYRTRHRVRRVQAGRPIDSLLDLQPNDYVVHVAHGIAKFTGIKLLTRGGRTEEYLALRFAGDAVLHVPASQIHLVHKYVGAFRGQPKLNALGSGAWERKKTQVGESLMDLAADLLETQARRQTAPGTAYPADSPFQKEFEDSFIYQETEDQLLTLRQIKKDLESGRPMDRLLCGDVGYGKTELAIRAAFKVAEAGKQVAVLVPTTVLAEQHERTFRERLADYPVSVESISRFRTGKQAKDILARTAAGQVDVLIGTHRLLSDDVAFRDLGLVVVDEEQRFGVGHKEQLKQMRATVEVLTMTATPIPRTLHMAMLGLRDISSLATPPMDRRSIHTEVVHYHRDQIRAAIVRELNRDGQVYFLHNRVHNIQSVADRLQQIVPEARIIVGHGQMPGRQLEKVMLTFVRGQADILVCTTIIQSGVDIPNVNTIFVHDADLFGLAELHQLRGRVGRYKHKAFCYLMLPERRPISPSAMRRLKALEEYSELGAGFRIALRDLEIRGAGNILGPEQSGHIAAVGYEIYCQLLEAAVRKLQGLPPETFAHAHLELGVGGYLPRGYIPADRQRMEVYRRLARSRNDEDVALLEADLIDAYGPLPPETRILIDQAQLRIRAAAHSIRSILAQPPDLIFTVEDPAKMKALATGGPGPVRVIDDATVHLRLTPAYFEPNTLMAVLRRLLPPARPTQPADK